MPLRILSGTTTVTLLLVGLQHAMSHTVLVDSSRLAGAAASGDDVVIVGSVHEARDAVRLMLADHPGVNVAVRLAPGLHDVGGAALEIGADDSPLAEGVVTWTSADPAAPAVISAAVKVTGWKPDSTRGPGVVAAPIPGRVPKGAPMRHLWVNGKRALKPRYYPRCPTNNCWQRSELVIVENSSVVPWGSSLPWGGYYFNATALDPSTFKNPEHVEFVYTGRAGARGDPPSGERDDQSGE
jgi:hypothetical protein